MRRTAMWVLALCTAGLTTSAMLVMGFRTFDWTASLVVQWMGTYEEPQPPLAFPPLVDGLVASLILAAAAAGAGWAVSYRSARQPGEVTTPASMPRSGAGDP